MKRYITFECNQSKIIQDNYGCAFCWNRIICGHDKDGDFMDCGTEDCRLPGLVRLKWIDRQIEENEVKAKIARKILQDSFEWLKVVRMQAPRSKKELLFQLGY